MGSWELYIEVMAVARVILPDNCCARDMAVVLVLVKVHLN